MNNDHSTTNNRKKFVFITFSVVLCLIIAVIMSMSERIRYQSDLFARWYATRELLDQNRSVYDPQNGMEIVEYKFINTLPEEAGFYYPAHLLLFMVPLATLPYEYAHFIWTAIGQLFFLIGLLVVAQELHWPPNVNQLTIFILLSLLFLPTIQHTIWSQFDTIAVLFFALCFLVLRKGKYVVAGILAVGLTFKPQGNFLLLLVLLLWSVLDRKRWGFIVGFFGALIITFVSTEFIQPNWIGDFIRALMEYRELPYTIGSVLDSWWNPYQITAILLFFIVVFLSIRLRKTNPNEPIFGIYLSLVMGLWWLIVPVIGMLHLVMMPIAFVFLISGLYQLDQNIYRYAIIICSIIYLLGYLGFIYGLSSSSLYGLHIYLSELLYKKIGVIFLILFTIPFIIDIPLKRG